MSKPSTELLAEFESWLASRPEAVREAARAYPPWVCYRSTENPGHYTLCSYGEPEDGGPITARIVHGKDSYMAGFEVFGVELPTLVHCDCGRWEWAGPDDLAVSVQKADAFVAANRAK